MQLPTCNNNKSLKILVSNHHLMDYTGSEVYTYFLAKHLKSKNHKPIVYSKYIDKIKNDFDNNDISITSSLESLKNIPFDVAHIHHSINAIEIRNAFPYLPLIYVSHGVMPFLEHPPATDIKISRYIAVSEEVRNNLINVGINPSKISLIRNIIDPNLFKQRRPIRKIPKYILIISARIDDARLNKIRGAANKLNMSVKVAGGRFGQFSQNKIADLIQEADIVFSLGRGVVEAIFSGRIPFVYDYLGGDGLINPDNFEESIKCNFSGRRYQKEFTTEELIHELKKYDHNDIGLLYTKASDEFSLNTNVDKLIDIYQSIKADKIICSKESIKISRYISFALAETRSYTNQWDSRNNLRKQIDPSPHARQNDNATLIKRNVYEVSIIIPLFNKFKLTKQCIDSIFKFSQNTHFELILVDNGSSDETHVELAHIAKMHSNIKVVINSKNEGYSAANNIGAKISSGKYLLLLNNDTVVTENWLQPLLDILDNDDTVAAVGPKLLFTDNRIQHAGVLIVNDKQYGDPLVARHVYYKHDRHSKVANVSMEYQAITGACFLVRKELYIDTKGLDDNFWNGYEDIDLCFKLRSMGYKIVYQPMSEVYHFESQSGPERFKKTAQNIQLLHKKWLGVVTPDLIIDINGTQIKSSINIISRYSSPNSTPEHYDRIFNNPMISGLTSIIILTFNQLEYTKRCIDSIANYTSEPHEIVFVDNGSTDGTAKWLKAICNRHRNYKLIRNTTNKGFAVGCNQGIKAASGEYVLLLNNDVIVTKHWLSRMLQCLKADVQSGIVGPMTNNISGSQRVPRVAYNSIKDLPAFAESFFQEHRHRRIRYQRIVGFCMLFRRNIVERIGMLDASFGTGNFEDDDFCLRSVLHGYHNYIAADVFIHHFGSRSFIGNRINYNDLLNNNKDVFLDKWNAVKYGDPLFEELFLANNAIKAEELIHMGLHNKAEELLLDGIRRFPGRHQLVYQLADLLLGANRYEETLNLLNAIPHPHLRIEGLSTKGLCHEGLGQLPEAEDIADQLCRCEEAKAPGWNLKGIIAYKRKDSKTAESCFKTAIDCDSGYGEAYANLGIICWENGKQDQALTFFSRSFMLSPTSATNAVNYHAAAIACSAIEQAQKDFLEAGALFPLNKQIAYLHIDLLIRQGDHQAAIEAIENAILFFGIDDGMLKAALEVRHHIGPDRIEPTRSSGPTVSLCMIVKNEEAYLAACLHSLKPLADELIIVDTGSTDATRDIAEVFGAQVFDFEWNDDFAAARNHSLAQASGDWILIMDADEVIAAKDHQRLLEMIKKTPTTKSTAFMMATRNYTDRQDSADFSKNTGEYHEEKSLGWIPSKKVRLFRNRQGIHFVYPVHEQVDPVLTEIGISMIECPVPVHHYGKLDPVRTTERWNLYYDIGKKKLASNVDYDHALKELAIQAGLLSKWEEAAAHWHSYLARNPDAVDACLNLTSVMAKAGDFKQANRYAQRAFQLSPERSETIYNLALSELQTGQAAKAAQTAARMVDLFPDDLDGRLLRAISEICAGNLGEGSKQVLKLTGTVAKEALLPRIGSILASIRSAGFDAWLTTIGAELSRMPDLQDIAQQSPTQTAKAVSLDPEPSIMPNDNLSSLFDQANQYYEQEAYQTAFDLLSPIVASRSDHWEACRLLVDVMLQSGQEQSIPEQLRPLEGRPDLPAWVLALIGSGYEAAGDLPRAAAFADHALEMDNTCARGLNLKGVLAYRDGNPAEAVQHFKIATQSNASWGEPWTNMGNILWEQGNSDNAMDCLEKGFTLSPTAPNVASTYHAAVSQTGRFEQAKPLFEAVVAHYPDFRQARFLLIDILIRLEDYPAALNHIEAVLVRWGTDPQLLEAAKAVRTRIGPMTIQKSKHPSLSLCMIVKNEEKYLPRCLESLKPLVDEMIVVDTGSSDTTRDIAEVFGARVFDFEWIDDFAAARNHSLAQASGDWILVMDADEVIAASDHKKIRRLVSSSKSNRRAFMVVTRNYTDRYNIVGWEPNAGQYPEEQAGNGWIPSEKVRIFPNDKAIRFEYPVHEVVGPSLSRKRIPIRQCPCPVHHYGKLDSTGERQKDEHYFKIGMAKLSASQNDPVAMRELAIQASKLGKHEDSISLWKRLIEHEPNNARSYINLASNQGKLKRYREARKAARKAVELAPDLKEGHLNLGLSELHLGNFTKAETILSVIAKKYNHYYSAILLLGASQMCQGKVEEGAITIKSLKSAKIWPHLSHAIQELVEGLMAAEWFDASRNLIAGSEALHCSNTRIREYGRQLERAAA